MNMASPTRSTNHAHAAAIEVEGELRAILKGTPSGSAHPATPSESSANAGKSFVQQFLAPSLNEIDNLMAQLQKMRDFLQSEGQRIEHEMAEYAQLSEAAMKSTRIIAENMTHRNRAG
jgi:hypothetical protein